VSLREREAWRKYFKDLNELIDILARYPQFIELIPPSERKKYELPSLLDEYPEMEKWLSFEAREIWKRQKEIQSGIVSLAEAPSPPSVEKVKALIYRVIYFSPPQPDRILVQKDKEAIGILYFRPHLFDFDIPIKEIDTMGKIIRICPTAEWWEGERILPVLKRWAPSHEMDFWEWCAWADFLLKRLEKETSDPILTIPTKGYWEEKVISKESSDEVVVDYDVLAKEPVKKKQKHRWLAWREKVYIEGWNDILLECMDLGLANVETEEDITKILEEARERWQKYSL
jgi:hypothetical protein